MKKFKKNIIIILIIISLIIFTILYIMFYFIPIYKKIVFSKVNIDRHNETIEEMNINVFLNKKETKKLESTKKEFSYALKELPQTERNPEIVRSILNFSYKSGALLKSVDFGNVSEFVITPEDSKNIAFQLVSNSNVKKEKLIMVPVKLSLEGDYAKVKKFVELLEGDKRISQIDNVSISKGKAQIDMTYYYFNSSVNREEPYNFCDKIYGKENIFKE